MKHRTLLTLAVAGALLLTLPACSPKETEATPTPDALPTESMNIIVTTPEAQPTESMNVIVTSPEPDPTQSVNVIAPEETDTVVEPLESQGPVQSHPIETQTPTPEPTSEPTPEPTPEAPAASLTAADVYAKVSAVAGGNPMSDMGFVLEEFYNLSTDDLEDFAFYMPEMSATNEEIFIAKVKSGKLDTVKSACESRHQGLKEEASMYPVAAEYVESAKIVTNGDWIMFVVVANPAEAESAFNDCTK